jgi:hypothetical protein
MRTVSLVIATEFAATNTIRPLKTDSPTVSVSNVVNSVLQRADEPGEMLAYWHLHHGRVLPYGLKRGIAKATTRLYSARSVLKYDTNSQEYRFGDVIQMVHPKPIDSTQKELFGWLIGRRYKTGGDAEICPNKIIQAVLDTENIAPENRREMMKTGLPTGFTWERLAGWIPNGMDKEAWKYAIDEMGTFALLRNLRNFDEAGVSQEVKESVARILCDEETVRGSKLFPFRFYQAYKNVSNNFWKWPLERALQISVQNLPRIPGRTLIMVDNSGSMMEKISSKSTLGRNEVAGLLAACLTFQCEASNVVIYDTRWEVAKVFPGINLLAKTAKFSKIVLGGSTHTWNCTLEVVQGASQHGITYDRIVILTDEQTSDSFDELLRSTPVITWNLAEERVSHALHGMPNRILMSGFTDRAMEVLPLISEGKFGQTERQRERENGIKSCTRTIRVSGPVSGSASSRRRAIRLW